jgi:hypothetical protein
MKFLLGSLLYLALAQASATPPPVPSIEVRASTTNVSIGERFQVTVELRGPNGATYDFPKEIVDSSVELIHAAAAQPLARIAIYDTQVFAIDAQARIPEISIQYTLPDGSKGSVKSTPLALNVVSTLDPNEPNPAPADFAPPMPVLVSRAFWVTAALAALLVIALLVFLFRRLRLPKKPKDPERHSGHHARGGSARSPRRARHHERVPRAQDVLHPARPGAQAIPRAPPRGAGAGDDHHGNPGLREGALVDRAPRRGHSRSHHRG